MTTTMRTVLTALRQHVAALRMLLIFTAIVGIIYPLAVTAIAQIPGLQGRADGSLIRQDGRVVGSKLIGQSFTDKDGNPLPQYFHRRHAAEPEGQVRHRDTEPAYPGLFAKPGNRQALRRRRLAAVLHA